MKKIFLTLFVFCSFFFVFSIKNVSAEEQVLRVTDTNYSNELLNFINDRNNLPDNLYNKFVIFPLRSNNDADITLFTFDDLEYDVVYTIKTNYGTNKGLTVLNYYTNEPAYFNINTENIHMYRIWYDDETETYSWKNHSQYAYNNFLDFYSNYDSNFFRGEVIKSSFDIKFQNNNEVAFQKNFSLEPTMTLKGMYNSNDEDIFEIGKITLDFRESDTSIQDFNYFKIRLQTISNDLTEEHIPIFSHYKIYGKTNDMSQNADYEEIDLKEFEFLDDDEIKKGLNFEVTNKEYDYVENRLAMSMLELKFSFLENANTNYEYWKIEFYFDNAENGTINVYDSLENSLWDCSAKFLDEYDFYYFPSNYKYAYISSENYQNTGRVYFPTNSILNPEILLQGQYFNINTGTYESPLETQQYNDTFYSYIDFDFNNSKQLFVLNRTYGTVQNNHGLYYGSNFLEFIYENFYNINNKIDKLMEYNKELTYFYVPKGYTVVFSDGNGTYQINTGNGYITIDESNNTNIYEANEKNKSVSLGSVLQEIIEMFGNVTKPIEKTKDIYNIFRSSKIGNYIFLVITTSIIILVIKSFRR